MTISNDAVAGSSSRRPRRCPARTRWPVEETGRYSVRPSTIPSRTATSRGMGRGPPVASPQPRRLEAFFFVAAARAGTFFFDALGLGLGFAREAAVGLGEER